MTENTEQKPKQLSKKNKYFLLLAMILSGFMNTIAYQFQNKTQIHEPGYPLDDGQRNFYHPYMQAVAMFLGEAICIFLFLYYKQTNKKEYLAEKEIALANGKQNPNYFMIILPAFSDACTSTLQHVALVFISPSIYQMMRGGTIAIIAFSSRIFLKRNLQLYQYIGCVIVIIGIAIVGAKSLILGSGGDAGTPSEQAIAIVMMVASLFTAAFTYICEEYLMRKYYLHPFQLVGFEGIWGLLIYMGLFMPLLEFLPCHLPAKACVFAPSGKSNFERVPQYFTEMTQNALLCTMCILGVFSISVFNLCGVSVTKYISSLTRSVVDQIRTILVWIFSLIITWTGFGQWENTSIASILLQLAGFIILMIGQVTYQGILKWPCCPPMPIPEIEGEEEEEQDSKEQELKKSLISEDNLSLQNIDNNQEIYLKKQTPLTTATDM